MAAVRKKEIAAAPGSAKPAQATGKKPGPLLLYHKAQTLSSENKNLSFCGTNITTLKRKYCQAQRLLPAPNTAPKLCHAHITINTQ